jgi:hypothetical protein
MDVPDNKSGLNSSGDCQQADTQQRETWSPAVESVRHLNTAGSCVVQPLNVSVLHLALPPQDSEIKTSKMRFDHFLKTSSKFNGDADRLYSRLLIRVLVGRRPCTFYLRFIRREKHHGYKFSRLARAQLFSSTPRRHANHLPRPSNNAPA